MTMQVSALAFTACDRKLSASSRVSRESRAPSLVAASAPASLIHAL